MSSKTIILNLFRLLIREIKKLYKLEPVAREKRKLLVKKSYEWRDWELDSLVVVSANAS